MVAWQIFGIATRMISALTLVWLLNTIWTPRKFEHYAIAFLYMVYPGFRQQYIPFTYSQVYIVLAVFYLSLGTMILAFRNRRWFWPLLLFSVLLSAWTMFTVEYYIGLELLRPLLLWLTMEDKEKGWINRLWHALLRWLPYLSLLGGFVLWRGANETPRGEITIINDFLASPISTLISLIRDIAEDIVQSTLLAWWDTLNISQLDGTKWFIIATYAAVLILTSIFTIIYLNKLSNDENPNDKRKKITDRQWALEAILLGVFALLAGGWPIWVTNMHMDLFFPWDRFTLLMMTGASILFTGIVALLVRKQLWKAVIIGLAVGLAAGMHFLSAITYRQDWSIQKDYFWQMVWRMPGIEQGTALITPSLPFEYVTDNSLTAPLNWIYSPGDTSYEMPYLMLDLDARVGIVLEDVTEDTPFVMPYRGTTFNGTTSQAIVAFYDPPRCFKVLDPALDTLWPNKPNLLTIEAIRLSKPELIQTNPDQPAEPPTHIFGTEPDPDWCYYFEKAELARQNGDWEEITILGDQALKLEKSFSKETAPELTPFIEGYARSGQWDKAVELSLEIKQYTPKIDRLLCQIWFNIKETTDTSEESQEAFNKIQKKFQCQNP